MGGFISAFLIGVIVTSAVFAVTSRKLYLQKVAYENKLGGRDAQLKKYELDRAYQEGRNFERNVIDTEYDNLMNENNRLRQENIQLCQQLGQESIFAHTIAIGKSAAVCLRRVKPEG